VVILAILTLSKVWTVNTYFWTAIKLQLLHIYILTILTQSTYNIEEKETGYGDDREMKYSELNGNCELNGSHHFMAMQPSQVSLHISYSSFSQSWKHLHGSSTQCHRDSIALLLHQLHWLKASKQIKFKFISGAWHHLYSSYSSALAACHTQLSTISDWAFTVAAATRRERSATALHVSTSAITIQQLPEDKSLQVLLSLTSFFQFSCSACTATVSNFGHINCFFYLLTYLSRFHIIR